MYRTSRVIIESKPLEGEARHVRRCPVRSVSTVWAYFPDNDRRSTHNPLHRDFQRPKDSPLSGQINLDRSLSLSSPYSTWYTMIKV